MNTKQNLSLSDLFQHWHAEDRELESCVDVVRQWMQEVAQLGIPHFGETATRLAPLRDRLQVHFRREDQMIGQLSELYPSKSPEVSAVRRQASVDHDRLAERLEGLIQRLDQLDPPFDSWQAAIDEVEMFVDLLEQHEEHESESIKMLMPAEFRTTGNRGSDD